MEKHAIAFLINPVSGGGLGAKVFSQLPEIMSSFGYDERNWTASFTEETGLIPDTDSLLQSTRRIIAVGGDGTIGSILNHLRKNPCDAEVGLIPLGTGNDLARTLGIYDIYLEKGLLACIKRLLRASSTEFDMWNVNQEITMSTYLSMGMDAAILHDFDSARREGRLLRSALFNKLYYVFRFFSRYSYRIRNSVELKLKMEHGTKVLSLRNSSCCLIVNINSYAGGAYPFDKANFNDGKLDVIVFKKLWTYVLISGVSRIFPRCYKWIERFLRIYQATAIEIINPGDEYIQIDGEDISGKYSKNGLKISASGKVFLLDLRKPPFELF